MILRVMVAGSAGNMGAMACGALREDPQIQQIYEVTRGQSLVAAIKAHAPDVLVELTDKDSVFENSHSGVRSGVPTVVGASGVTEDQLRVLDKAGKESGAPVLVVPNFSISAVLMMQMASQAARYFPHAEIIEMHHPKKVDAPSGTAIATAERMQGMATAMSNDHPAAHCVDGVPIHSIRMPGLFAHQQVIFSREGERLTLQQDW